MDVMVESNDETVYIYFDYYWAKIGQEKPITRVVNFVHEIIATFYDEIVLQKEQV